MDAYEAILSLRAVRHFTDEPLPGEVVERILQAARWTGSAKNTQPWQFVVIRSRETLQALAACGAFATHLAGAALAVMVVTPPGYALFDAGRVVQNLMLAASTLGVGSCIATLQEEERARALLGIPADLEARHAISLGYPLPDPPQTIEGQPRERILASLGRRPLDELVHWERW